MKPLVSILIPAYNAEAWIGETIKSALEQTWPRKEIIVVDDGSSDRTLSVAREFASKDVAVVTQENQGAASARNQAWALSQGDYIQWLDADDLLGPEKVQKQMEAATKIGSPRTLFSCAWGYFAYRPERAKFSPTSLWCDLSPVEWLLRKMGHNLHMQTATWLTSRELTEAAGAWDMRMFVDDDGEYFCRVLLASDGVHFVPSVKVFYRANSSTRLSYIGRSDKKKDAQLLSMQLHPDDSRVGAAPAGRTPATRSAAGIGIVTMSSLRGKLLTSAIKPIKQFQSTGAFFPSFLRLPSRLLTSARGISTHLGQSIFMYSGRHETLHLSV